MSTEQTEAIVIRQADFSESSRVVTFFSGELGKVSCVAKGAKRLKGSFELSLNLLSHCRIVLIHKFGGGLDILTESKLLHHFHPAAGSLTHLYTGYYVAELLNLLMEERDPHPAVYSAALEVLQALSQPESPFMPLARFEIATLREIGHLPEFENCTICQSAITEGQRGRFWVSQGGLICSNCGRSEYDSSEFHAGSLAVLRHLLAEDPLRTPLEVSRQQQLEIRKVLNSAIAHVLGRRPKTLGLLKF